jgi:hypothetical protein
VSTPEIVIHSVQATRANHAAAAALNCFHFAVLFIAQLNLKWEISSRTAGEMSESCLKLSEQESSHSLFPLCPPPDNG